METAPQTRSPTLATQHPAHTNRSHSNLALLHSIVHTVVFCGKRTKTARAVRSGRVIERLPRESDVVARVVIVDHHVESIVPRVEDTEVVVRGNPSDQAVDDQRRAVPPTCEVS